MITKNEKHLLAWMAIAVIAIIGEIVSMTNGNVGNVWWITLLVLSFVLMEYWKRKVRG